jgi:hypothetical protein
MGADRWVNFETKEERARVRAYLRSLEGSFLSHASNGKEAALWIETFDRGYSKEEGEKPCFGLLLAYSFGTDQSDELAVLVSRELARRFRVVQIGSSCIGWYLDKDWQSDRPKGPVASYGTFPSWVEWVKVWNPEWSYYVRLDDSGGALVFLQSLEKFVVELFEKLDQAALDNQEST